MKKSLIILLGIILILGSVLADCNLDISLLNQDPDPAVPGDYVKLLFKVSGVGEADCGDISLELLENYPLKFDPDFNPVQTQKAGAFAKDYKSNDWTVPYKVRIDSSAIDGNSKIELLYSTKGRDSFKVSKTFDLRIKEVKANFDIFVRSYDYSNGKLVLDILNTAKNNVEAVIVTIPNQKNIEIRGANRNIVGGLDSVDYTSTDFNAIPSDGKFNVEIEYTDEIGERRVIEKEVSFESEYFLHTKPSKTAGFSKIFIIFLIVILIIGWRLYSKNKKKSK